MEFRGLQRPSRKKQCVHRIFNNEEARCSIPEDFRLKVSGSNPKVRVHRRNKRRDATVDGGLVRARGDERRRIPEAIASPLRSGKREAPPVRAICIQRPSCRERGEVAINNATHHQYLAGITARTPIQKRGEREREPGMMRVCTQAGAKGTADRATPPILTPEAYNRAFCIRYDQRADETFGELRPFRCSLTGRMDSPTETDKKRMNHGTMLDIPLSMPRAPTEPRKYLGYLGLRIDLRW